MKLLLALLVTTGICSDALGLERDLKARRTFLGTNACPSTGKYHGACPGFQVDHKRPLAAGGKDDPDNMQWLSISDHKAKTSYERRSCIYGCGVKH